MLSSAQRAAAWAGGGALVCLGYGGYAMSTVAELKARYGDDDRILIQQLHAVAGIGLGIVVAGWAVSLLRGGQRPVGPLYRARPGDWSGWMLVAGFAALVALLAFGYDGARYGADAYRAADGRGVHGTLTVQECSAEEYGFTCEGTFRADDGSFEVQRVSAYADDKPAGTLDGWVSGPRPLAMFDGTAGAWHGTLIPLGVLGVLWLALFAFLSLIVVRRRASQWSEEAS